MKAKSKHYREVKNYIHNDLKLTREDIREIIRDVVKEECKQLCFHNVVEREVHSWICDQLYRNSMYYKLDKELMDIIKSKISDSYNINISISSKDKEGD